MTKAILTNKRVLVTGGAGFIGSNIVEKLLKQDNQVVCLDNFATGKRENIQELLSNKNFTLIEGDIRDLDICKKAVQEIDVVLHQAALGSVPRSIHDPKTTNDVNIGGFMNMLSATKDAGIKRFVYAASSSTYGDNKDLPKLEDNIGKPLSPYAVTKYVNELYAKVFSDLYGIETIGLRYFNVFGKRQDPEGAYAAVFPKFIALFLKHQSPLIHGDGNQSRDFTYVENVVQANELAATTTNPEALNTVYNIAFGESNTLNELTQEIKKLLSKYDPKIADIQPVYGDLRKGDILHSLASIDKAKKLLGYNPQFDVHKGLELAIHWYYSNLKA
ncbi:MAG: SDR family oxidoreductase [Bacteroidales bacterium]|nr:SDR family oxidoreductase [Bacteroidales bacterium]